MFRGPQACVLGRFADQIISWGDSRFVLYVLNDNDMKALNRYNAH